MRRPIVEFIEQLILLAGRTQEVQDPAFQERAAFLRRDRPVQLLHRTDHA